MTTSASVLKALTCQGGDSTVKESDGTPLLLKLQRPLERANPRVNSSGTDLPETEQHEEKKNTQCY